MIYFYAPWLFQSPWDLEQPFFSTKISSDVLLFAIWVLCENNKLSMTNVFNIIVSYLAENQTPTYFCTEKAINSKYASTLMIYYQA